MSIILKSNTANDRRLKT